MKSLDLFPYEAAFSHGLPIQGRILLRRSQCHLHVIDVRDFIKAGSLSAQHDPDQAQKIGAGGF